MNKNARKLINWIKKSGLTKADGKLCDGKDSYCILGAIDKVYAMQTKQPHYDPIEYDKGDDSFLPESALRSEVAEYFGFKDKCPVIRYEGDERKAFDLNDDTDLSLVEIAELIEDQAESLFKPEPKPKKAKAKKVKTPKPVEPKVTLKEYLGMDQNQAAFVDAHLAAEKRRELQNA